MRKFIITGMAVAMLAIPSVASADAPNGDYFGSMKEGVAWNNFGYQVTPENASLIGEFSARSIQNGQFVSGNEGPYDQTTTPGSRADAVQSELARTGLGRDGQ